VVDTRAEAKTVIVGGVKVCAKCGHDNANVRIGKTLLRRRVVAECGHMEGAVSGMAGAEVCLCRGAAHQTVGQ
jgi:hypothetical protein